MTLLGVTKYTYEVLLGNVTYLGILIIGRRPGFPMLGVTDGARGSARGCYPIPHTGSVVHGHMQRTLSCMPRDSG